MMSAILRDQAPNEFGETRIHAAIPDFADGTYEVSGEFIFLEEE